MKTKFLYIIGMLLLLSSCFKDDLEDCPVILHLYCESVMQKYNYENVVDQLNIYLYDGGDQLVDKFTFPRRELLDNDFNAIVPIQHYGNYTLVAAVNPLESYTMSGTDTKNAYKISLNANSNNQVSTKQNDLYHGHKELSYSFTGIVNQYDTIDVYKNTNYINLNLSFEHSLLPNSKISTYLKGNNGSFGYNNKCHAQSERVYLPHTEDGNADLMKFQFTTMQLWIGSDLTLYVEEEIDGNVRIANQLNIVEQLSELERMKSSIRKMYSTSI